MTNEEELGFFHLAWEDVIFSHILPFLSWKDLFLLRRVNSEGAELIDEYFSQLKSIEIFNHSHQFKLEAFQVLTRRATGIKKLVINNSSWIKDKELGTFFRTNTGLTHLDLAGCSGLNGTCMLALSVKCKNLKELILRGCAWITRGALETLMSHNKSLEVVDLSSCAALGDPFLVNFVQRFPRLKRLYIAHIRTVDDNTLIAISRSCRELQVLDIQACMSVTDHGIRSIAEYCPNLKELRVAQCHLVTEFSLRLLRGRDGLVLDRPQPVEQLAVVPFDNLIMVQV